MDAKAEKSSVVVVEVVVRRRPWTVPASRVQKEEQVREDKVVEP
jgi:hypothetical protein